MLLFVIAVVATPFVVVQVGEGKNYGGVPLKLADYLQWVLGLLWLWSSFAALVGLIRLIRKFGSVR